MARFVWLLVTGLTAFHCDNLFLQLMSGLDEASSPAHAQQLYHLVAYARFVGLPLS